MSLKQELRNSQLSAEVARSSEVPEMTNVDIIRRVSQLEKTVYGNKSELENKEEE